LNAPFQRQRREWLGALAGATLLGSCAVADSPAEARAPSPKPAAPPVAPQAATPDPRDLPPPAPREFRAAWVATVANIDWPSKPGLSADALRSEALAILDRARQIGLNALILQVRPAGDALYPSTLEPWSEVLSGEQGRPPWSAREAAWDPLAFWVHEAHRRALELHVWFNPYRARHSSAKSPLVAPHIGSRLPAVVKRYGDQLWMDPGEPAAAAHSLAVVADVVRRYDVDGVHIDDYFYPYPVPSTAAANGPDTPFPDSESFARYQLAGGTLERDDWRRSNVDRFVQDLYTAVHQTKPWVRVGISPFGVGKPDRRPAGVAGFSQYDKLYADVEKWVNQGWLDYLAPQLYWQVLREGLPFEPLLDQWVAENPQQRHLWPGFFTSQLGKPGWKPAEILQQIQLQRARGDKATGHIHFSMVALMQDREGIATQLRNGPYAQAALVPATPWLDGLAPPAPRLQREGTRVRIVPGAGEVAQRWAVWRRSGQQWRFTVQASQETLIDSEGADLVATAAVDRVGNLSPGLSLGLSLK
jgi:uncharacterized lipoprotein YddW (UPF0748 family)